MHRPGGDLGKMVSPSDQEGLDTVELARKQAFAVCVQALFRLSVSKQEWFRRKLTVSAAVDVMSEYTRR